MIIEVQRSSILEVCVESFDDALVAIAGGTDRIEYCSALAVGGLTPTPGAMLRLQEISVPCMVMIRLRPGNFVYSASEIAIMAREIAFARDCGARGVVIGSAKPDGTLDGDGLAALMSAAQGLETTLHRVFDDTPDPFTALETAIELGFDRILTSGQQPTAEQGADVIANLIKLARGRIGILPGCGIDAQNAARILDQTGASDLHASCKKTNPNRDGYAAGRVATDGDLVRALRTAMG